jgi:hypothetical protein
MHRLRDEAVPHSQTSDGVRDPELEVGGIGRSY